MARLRRIEGTRRPADAPAPPATAAPVEGLGRWRWRLLRFGAARSSSWVRTSPLPRTTRT